MARLLRWLHAQRPIRCIYYTLPATPVYDTFTCYALHLYHMLHYTLYIFYIFKSAYIIYILYWCNVHCSLCIHCIHCKCCIQVIYGSPCWLVGHYEETNTNTKNTHTPQETYLTLHNMDCPSCKLAVIQIFNGAALNLLYGKCVKVWKRGKLNQIGSKFWINGKSLWKEFFLWPQRGKKPNPQENVWSNITPRNCKSMYISMY